MSKKASVLKSENWVRWCLNDKLKNCDECVSRKNKIISTVYKDFLWPPVHDNCGCDVFAIDAYTAGTATDLGLSGPDHYLSKTGMLPDYYITKDEAERLGWIDTQGNLADVAPGKVIGGDIFKNKKGELPSANGRIWYEADINYKTGFRKGQRIVFSNDGLIFVSYDHYKTFNEIIPQGE